jgi:hypothetical protein
MSQEWRPNQAISISLLLATMQAIKERIQSAPTSRVLNHWNVLHTFVIVTYVVSLRGPEGFFIYLEGLHRHWKGENEDNCIIALRGKIKGEHNARRHLLPCVPTTGTGLRIQESPVVRLMKLKVNQGLMDGRAILKENGNLFSSRAIHDSLLVVMQDFFGSNRDLFPTKFETTQDIRKSYQVFRTLRRTSDTEALEMKVNKDDDGMDVVDRWAGVEKAQRRQPGREMRHCYADIMLLIKPFQRYCRNYFCLAFCRSVPARIAPKM